MDGARRCPKSPHAAAATGLGLGSGAESRIHWNQHEPQPLSTDRLRPRRPAVTASFDFAPAFQVLTGHPPFPWQRRLFDCWLSQGELPAAVDIPTGLGKTAVMALWLLARAGGAPLPRRIATP